MYEEMEYLQVALLTEDDCVQFKQSLLSLDIVDNDCECMYYSCSYTVLHAGRSRENIIIILATFVDILQSVGIVGVLCAWLSHNNNGDFAQWNYW